MSIVVWECSKRRATKLPELLAATALGMYAGFLLGVWCSSKSNLIALRQQRSLNSLSCIQRLVTPPNLSTSGAKAHDHR